MTIILVVELDIQGQALLHQEVGVILVPLRVLVRIDVHSVEGELALLVAVVSVDAVVLQLLHLLIHVVGARIELPLISSRLDVQLFNGNSKREFLSEVLVVVVVLKSNMHPAHFQLYVLEDEADVLHLLLLLDQAIPQLLYLSDVLCVLHRLEVRLSRLVQGIYGSWPGIRLYFHLVLEDIESVRRVVTHIEYIFRRFLYVALVVASEECARPQHQVNIVDRDLERTRPKGEYTEGHPHFANEAGLELQGNAKRVNQFIGHVLLQVEVRQIDRAAEV